MTAANAGDIPWLPAWGQTYLWQFGWGARSRVISSAASNEDGHIAGRLMANKMSSKLLIESLGLPTSKYAMVANEADIPAALDRVGFPCVVKPVDRADRIWICADDLPDEWLDVLANASASPAWRGLWSEWQNTSEFEQLVGDSEGAMAG